MIDIAHAASEIANNPQLQVDNSLLPTAHDWVIIVVSAFLGFLLSLPLIIFSDFFNRIPFLYPRHVAKLKGKAILLHHLTAKRGSLGNDEPVDLSTEFRHPGKYDGTEWDVSNLEMRTRWNKDARLTCFLSWNQNGKPWTAKVTGSGRYFGKNWDDFDGYVYVVCDCEGKSGDSLIHWKVVYELRRKLDPTEGWDGYWLMFDAEDRTHSKFGSINLENAN